VPTFFPYNCDNNRTGVEVMYNCVSQIVVKFWRIWLHIKTIHMCAANRPYMLSLKPNILCEIEGPHGSEYQGFCVLGCDTA